MITCWRIRNFGGIIRYGTLLDLKIDILNVTKNDFLLVFGLWLLLELHSSRMRFNVMKIEACHIHTITLQIARQPN